MKRSWWFSPGESTRAIFVRLALAGVFIPEGLQKLTHATFSVPAVSSRLAFPGQSSLGRSSA